MFLVMFEKVMAILHVAPFFMILALTIGSFIYEKTTKDRVRFNLSSTILLLTSIGIASGFGAHHNHAGEGAGSCYLCLGYASILALQAYNMMKATTKTQKVRINNL